MPVNCPACSAEVPNVIAKSRFDEVYNERKALKASVKALETKAEEGAGTAEQVATLTAQLADAQAAAAEASGRFDRHQAITGAGFDPSLVDAIEWAHSRIEVEEGAERPSLADALASWTENPDAAPVILRPHLPKPATEQPAAEQPAQTFGLDGKTQTQVRTPAPKVDSGVKQTTKAPNAWTAQSIVNASPEDMQNLLADLDAKGAAALQ
jgi:hypothetical protein